MSKVSIMNCWTCGIKLRDRPEECFFWCTEEHKTQYFEEQKQKSLETWDEHLSKVKVSFDLAKIDEIKRAKEETAQQLNGNGTADVNNSTKKRVYKCKICGKIGHNSRRCKEKFDLHKK